VTQVEPAADLAAALAVLDAGLGLGAYTLEGLRTTSAGRGAVLVARQGDEVIGAAVVELVGTDRSWYDRFGEQARVQLTAAHRPGSLGGAAVVPQWRGRGVGRQLQAAMLTWLAEQGCDLAVAVAWLHPGDGQSQPLLERAGFTPIARAEDVYLEDSLNHGLVCSYCGGACHCAGMLFVQPLS
jgi:GNAT superfamily N-acetyltransferase